MFKLICQVVLVAVVTAGASTAFAQRFAVTVDYVEGVREWTVIRPGQDLRFIIRFKNDSTVSMGILNGFEVYSNDGAVWQTTETDTIGWRTGDPSPGVAILGRADFDLNVALRCHSCNGSGYDTTGILAAPLSSTGLPPGFNDTAIAVVVTGITTASIGKHICIDSCAILPGGGWKWAPKGGGSSVFPFWPGPYCFVIDTVCCLGSTGNVDDDVNGVVDISDLVALVEYQFEGGSVACDKELNVDGSADGVIDISDLSWLIDFVFFNGPAPQMCL